MFLSKRRQCEKATYSMIPTIQYALEKAEVWRQEKDGCQVKRGGKGKLMEHGRFLEQ